MPLREQAGAHLELTAYRERVDTLIARVRLRAVQDLTRAAPPEAAIPLVRALADKDDDIQFQAIAGELNIFLAEPVIPRKKGATCGSSRTG